MTMVKVGWVVATCRRSRINHSDTYEICTDTEYETNKREPTLTLNVRIQYNLRFKLQIFLQATTT